MKNRVQKLLPCFWPSEWRTLDGRKIIHNQNETKTIVYINEKPKCIDQNTRPDYGIVIGDDSIEAKTAGFAMVARGNAAERIAICFAFNPVTKQSEVINFSEVGIYADMVWRPSIVRAIEKSKREVFPNGIPQIQIVRQKTDPGHLKRTPANGVLTEEEMSEAQKRVDAMQLITK